MLKRFMIGIGVLAMLGTLVVAGMMFLRKPAVKVEETVQLADSLERAVKVKEPRMLYGYPVDSLLVITDKIKRNQNISDILLNYNVPFATIHELAIKSENVFDVRKIVTNKDYTVICEKDSLQTAKAFIYEPSPSEYIIFNLSDSLHIERMERPIETREQTLSGIIEYSLAETMESLDISPQLTNLFVDVYGWQVDFFRLQRGDKFKIIYEEKFVEDQSIGIGKIKAAVFNQQGVDMIAVGFDQGHGYDYFDLEGKNLRKAFLKYPLEFTRISSRYSGNRFHPVLKRWRAHRGTDFVAPRGTPIRSVGDGVVVEAGYKGGNGNYVKIKHNATYSTQYLHMSRIGSGIRTGVRVKRGETIGYVGSTGLATGNHLCYRFWKNGVQVDALQVDLPPAEPVAAGNLEEYKLMSTQLASKLNAIEYPADPTLLARGQD